MSLSKITLIGHLGRDPEVRDYQGRKVANFSVAVSEKYKKSDGSENERTTWFRVSFWEKTAEIAEKYLKKGSQVYIEGRLAEAKIYQDKNGLNQVSLEVTGQTLQLLGSPSGQNSGTPTNNPQPYSKTTEQPVDNPFTPNVEEPTDDLPF